MLVFDVLEAIGICMQKTHGEENGGKGKDSSDIRKGGRGSNERVSSRVNAERWQG
jgi:hypothetical protein